MNSEFYRGFDDLFSEIKDFLSECCKSEILQTFFWNGLESLFYRNLVLNFFTNLNRDTINALELPKGNIGRIKTKYKEVQRDMKTIFFSGSDGKKIDEKYYKDFKQQVKRDFPGYERIITEIETEIDLTKTKRYLKERETEIKKCGKPERNLNAFLITETLKKYIDEKGHLPFGKKLDQLMKVVVKNCLPDVSQILAESLKKNSKEMLKDQRKCAEEFEKRLYTRWKEPLDLLECLIRVSSESGEEHVHKLGKTTDETNDDKRTALRAIHARSLHISNEILALLKSGFADGAIARWRSLHELAAISFFLLQNNNEVSRRYLEHEAVKSFKDAKDYREYYKKLGCLPIDRRSFNKLKKEKEKLCIKYGDRFQDDYGWIPKATLPNRNFRELEKHVKLDRLRPFYNLSCNAVHGSSKGFYRLGLSENLQDELLLVGPSIYGLADPIQNVSISLRHVSVCLLSMETGLGSIVQMQIMDYFVQEICPIADEVQKQIEKEESELIGKQTHQ